MSQSLSIPAGPPAPLDGQPADGAYFVRLGLIIVAAVFGGLVLWSLLAPIRGAVVASGQVVVESNRKTVQHLEGGTIGEILVAEGDYVEVGDVVARMEATVPRANVALIDGQLTELYARRTRVEAERDQLAEIAEPRGISEVLAKPTFRQRLEGQERLFDARRRSRRSQVGILSETIVQQEERIEGLEAQLSSLRKQQTIILEEWQGVRELNDRGFAPGTRVRELEREQERLRGEVGSLQASVAEARSRISEARIEIERLSDIVREEAITELREIEAQISELEERRITAADTLSRTDIRAPQSGRVLNLQVFTVGGVVGPGDPLMEIVPDGDALLIAARVAPQDVDKVQVGQETIVRFSTLSSRQTPEAVGVVKTVSADAVQDPQTGEQYYRVLVEFPDDGALDAALAGKQLVPGMPVESYIQTGSKPAALYLLKPLTDSLARSMRED